MLLLIILKEPTSAICPLSEEQIVFSMSLLKFHLRIDVKELSPNTSRVGKDLFKDDAKFYISSIDFTKKSCNLSHHIHIGFREREREKKKVVHKVTSYSPYFNYSSLIENYQSTLFLIFLECCSPATWFCKIHSMNGIAATLE